MNVCAEAGDIKSAETLFEQLKDRTPRNMQRMLFNTVIKACANAGDLTRAEQWQQRMEASGIAANAKHYGKLIEAAAKSGNVSAAEVWFQAMNQSGLPPDIVQYNEMIDACAKAGKFEAAEKWLTRARDAELYIDMISYGAVIDACAKAGEVQVAKRLFWEAKNERLQPDMIAYNALTTVCGRNGDLSGALELLAVASQSCLQPDPITYTAAIRACDSASPPRPALAEIFFRSMLAQRMCPEEVTCYELRNAVGPERLRSVFSDLKFNAATIGKKSAILKRRQLRVVEEHSQASCDEHEACEIVFSVASHGCTSERTLSVRIHALIKTKL